MDEPTKLSDVRLPSKQIERTISDIINGMYGFPTNSINGIILEGPNGTGKSLVATLLPDAIEAQFSGKPADAIIRSCRSPNNGLKALQKIADSTTVKPFKGQRYRYYVLDEVDHLTSDAMAELKMVMNPIEQSSISAVFIMTTNRIENIDNGVRSRSIEISFVEDQIYARVPIVKDILLSHGISDAATFSDEILYNLILKECNGDVRKIILESTRLANQILAKRKQNHAGTTP
jgi:replication-associated recombination protein RarA